MKRLTISLPDELEAWIGRESRRRKVSVSYYVRQVLETQRNPALDSEGRRLLPFIGIAHSSDGLNANDMDEYMAANWADDIARDR